MLAHVVADAFDSSCWSGNEKEDDRSLHPQAGREESCLGEVPLLDTIRWEESRLLVQNIRGTKLGFLFWPLNGGGWLSTCLTARNSSSFDPSDLPLFHLKHSRSTFHGKRFSRSKRMPR